MGRYMIERSMQHGTFSRQGIAVSREKSPGFSRGEDVNKEKSMAIRTGRDCVFMLHAHLIFITKYRGRVFTPSSLDRLEVISTKTC